MTKKIVKFKLELEKTQVIYISHFGKILSAIEHWGEINLCILGDDTETLVPVTVKIIETNDEFSNLHGFKFLDTVKLQGGNRIYHVFYSMGT